MVLIDYTIVESKPHHAEAICDVVICSIKTVCVADHHHDPKILKNWLSNKTPQNIKQWILDGSNYALTALNKQNNIIGVSIFSKKNGEILLNYILPNYLYSGVGKKMLERITLFAMQLKIKQLKVLSTITAAEFYQKNGFIKAQNSPHTRCLWLTKSLENSVIEPNC